MGRITEHPILDFNKGKKVTFMFNGTPVEGFEGESVAASLHAAGIRKLHESEVLHRPRGLFCAIGNCSSCVMRVNGEDNVRICVTPVREGLVVEEQARKAVLDPEKRHLPGSLRPKTEITTDVLVIGGGPAGMNAALEAASHGLKVILLERNEKLGGQLIKQTHKFFGSEKAKAGTRGFVIADELMEAIAASPDIEVMTGTTALGIFRDGTVMAEKDGMVISFHAGANIISVGAFEKTLIFPGNDLPGIYGAGAVQTLMNIEGVVPGSTVVMVGAGNIGLIVSYQLLQAGVRVAAVVEAAPNFGGYEVHANKLRRANVPILTGHTIKYAYGGDRLEGVVLTALDSHFKPVPGTEKGIRCDVVCMAVGLSPLSELFFQSGCEMKFIPELGGYVPKIDEYRRTTVKGLYAAGDASGIEEATSAQLTGRIAALTASNDLKPVDHFEELYRSYSEQLLALRSGPLGGKILAGDAKLRQEGGVDYEK